MSQSFAAIKTKELILQNPDGSFAPYGAVLHIEGDNGKVAATRDIDANTITVTNRSMRIDAEGNIVARTMVLLTPVISNGSVGTTNANLMISGDQDKTGGAEMRTLKLIDLSGTPVETELYVGTNHHLTWDYGVTGSINISEGIMNLGVDPGATAVKRPTDSSDSAGMFDALTTLLDIFDKRQIFIRYKR